MELSLRGSGITYVPGDVVGFRCPNRAADTAYLLERLQVKEESLETAVVCSFPVRESF